MAPPLITERALTPSYDSGVRTMSDHLTTPMRARDGAWPRIVLTAVLVLPLVVLTRRPDAVLHAQFWAEDGRVWFAEAYNLGAIQSLTQPVNGYFQTISRLTGLLGVAVGLRRAPLLFNVVAILIEALPAVLILSSRFRGVLPDLRVRALLALLYLALPNSYESHANLTNAQWHLGLAALLLVLANPPTSLLGRAFDIGVLSLSGLSGPLVLFATPVAARQWIADRTRWRLVCLIVVTCCAVIQLVALDPLAPGSRFARPAPNVVALVQLLGGQVFTASLIGLTHYSDLHRQAWWQAWGYAVAALGGVGLTIYATVRGSLTLRVFVAFAVLVLAAALVAPTGDVRGKWATMALPGSDNRYFQFPMLAWLACLTAAAFSRGPRAVRGLAGFALATCMVIGIPGDWNYTPIRFADFSPRHYSEVLDRAAPGSYVRIPINPPGWDMVLRKRSRR